MRKIKFRVWDKGWNEMSYPDTLEFDEGKLEWVVIGDYCDGDGRYLDKDEMALMQYTGLKDKNGKEIYEGDICHINDYPDKYGMYGEYGVVMFKSPCFGMELTDTKRFVSIDEEEIEVIGNIYENPELLKGDSE